MHLEEELRIENDDSNAERAYPARLTFGCMRIPTYAIRLVVEY